MTGQQFDALSEQEIDALPELPVVIARCAPETKVRMVEALHRRKIWGMTRFAVMTGDGMLILGQSCFPKLNHLCLTGVNDSPALKRADVGVAMGLSGADVAKSVSDIVLADDNFASITRAIRKGRGTLMNLSKFLLYLLSGNIAEVLVLIVGLAFLNEQKVSVYPLSPVAALWINTIAAGPPALALGLEPTAKDAMEKSPRAYKTIFTLWWYIDLIFYGILIGSLSIANFVIVVWGRGDGDLGINCNEGSYNNSCETRKYLKGHYCCPCADLHTYVSLLWPRNNLRDSYNYLDGPLTRVQALGEEHLSDGSHGQQTTSLECICTFAFGLPGTLHSKDFRLRLPSAGSEVGMGDRIRHGTCLPCLHRTIQDAPTAAQQGRVRRP